MAEPRSADSPIPKVRFSGRVVRANDRMRDVALTLSMVLIWLAGFAVWVMLWRHGREVGGFDGHLIRVFAFCAGAFHVVSMGIIRTAVDRGLSRLGW